MHQRIEEKLERIAAVGHKLPPVVAAIFNDEKPDGDLTLYNASKALAKDIEYSYLAYEKRAKELEQKLQIHKHKLGEITADLQREQIGYADTGEAVGAKMSTKLGYERTVADLAKALADTITEDKGLSQARYDLAHIRSLAEALKERVLPDEGFARRCFGVENPAELLTETQIQRVKWAEEERQKAEAKRLAWEAAAPERERQEALNRQQEAEDAKRLRDEEWKRERLARVAAEKAAEELKAKKAVELAKQRELWAPEIEQILQTPPQTLLRIAYRCPVDGARVPQAVAGIYSQPLECNWFEGLQMLDLHRGQVVSDRLNRGQYDVVVEAAFDRLVELGEAKRLAMHARF